MKFKNKTCVITGGANGIGRAIALEFAKKGANIAIIDVDKQNGDKTIENVNRYGVKSLFYCGDIADESTLESFINEIIKKFGSVDYLINNACISKSGIMSGCSFDDFNYVLRIGVTAPYMLAKLLLNRFNKGGAIVNISSTRAFMSQANTESYTAAKGGITALTHALAISLAGRVRVNSISPGWIDTSECSEDAENYANSEEIINNEANNNESDKNSTNNCHSISDKLQHPSGRIGRPIDIARAVMFLCDDDNSFITGENITIDGGMTKQMIYSGDNGWEYSVNK